jgi:fumarate hydratase class II
MNVNEVIANYANREAGKKLLHPNDDVNMSQSSNDVFPSAMHVSALISIENALLPALSELISELRRLEEENEGVIKCGRTHLQDATPIRFSAEISGWRSSLEKDLQMLNYAKETLSSIALGGTAVGSGLNAPRGFDTLVATKVSALTHIPFLSAENKYHALSSKDELVFVHGALKALAADLMKIANDVRWLASGPRCGLGEITIPENEPGSSIMPGKVNPTQCEAMTMVSLQVMANDVAVGLAASQGNFELNVYMPVCAYNFLQSCRLLADAMRSFRANCVAGIKANTDRMQSYLSSSLMLVTALNTHIGYENAAKIAKLAYRENITLKEAAEKLGLLTPEEFDAIVRPEKMV